MCFNIIDEDVIEITGFGKMYYEDTSMIKSIFRTDADNNIKFNTMENIQTLQEEGINYIVFNLETTGIIMTQERTLNFKF